MAAFSEATFDASSYASFRLSYPCELYDIVFSFHRKSPNPHWEYAIDLGCGTGQATIALTPFKRVTGVDSSQNMIKHARENLKKPEQHVLLDCGIKGAAQQKFDFVQSPAENLEFLDDESVDLVVSAVACHWFDWYKVWPQVARVLRKGGSIACWSHTEFRFPAYPHLTSLIVNYSEGTLSLGPYWERPGKDIVDRHLVDIPEPNDVVPGDMFEKLELVHFTGSYIPELQHTLPVIMRKTMTWNALLSYLRTWSGLHLFKQHNPDDAKHPDGSLETRYWNSLRAGAADERGVVPHPDSQVELVWPLTILLARKKGTITSPFLYKTLGDEYT